MGSYLSEPVTEKVSTDESNDKLICGASSMQGWRLSQEDAHNCLLDFDTNTSLFAVYDGHGGHEVAQYCSQKLPTFVQETNAYQEGNVVAALTDGFLGFDASIATREVVSTLKEIAGEKDAEEDSDEEENLNNLYEEAAMPIEQVIEKYTNLVNPSIKNLKSDAGDKLMKSPLLKAKKEDTPAVVASSSSGSSSSEATSSKSDVKSACPSDSSTNECVSSSCSDSNENKPTSMETDNKCDVKTETNGSPTPQIIITSSSPPKNEADVKDDSETTPPNQNGEVSEAEPKSDVSSSSSTPQENGDIAKRRKGKALTKTKGVETPPEQTSINQRSKRNLHQLYKNLLATVDDESSDEEDEEDTTVNIETGNSDEDSSAGEECDDEGEEEEEDEEEDGEETGEDEEDLEFARNMKEEPGSDSGCTAVVALLKGNELYVANAGDSRCIVCRNGKAIEMSIDHKPEDEPEQKRVVKAGGNVTMDGRVNGGLNLSRAIGDHAYKQNKELSDREQMITALPDVKTLTIYPGVDEFMVLACDGIWNFMSSQEVVDFVRPRIQENPDKLSHICEEMFDHCLAPNTMGDGTGCDNMTAIIVQFKANILKRAASPEPAENESKKAKTEDCEPQVDTTA